MMKFSFEWDPVKAATNEKKHGVAFTEAATVFSDRLSITFGDPDHSCDEERYVTMGRCTAGRLLVVAHTEPRERIRIISVRAMTPRERRLYENGE